MGQVGRLGGFLDAGSDVCDAMLGAVPRGVVCGYGGCVWGIVERVVRRRRVGKEFPLDAGAGAAGCGYFFSFAKGGGQGVGGAETCVGGGIVGAGGVGGDFVHAG